MTQPENIIMIMNESLADFESVGEISTDSEILPFIHSLKQNVKYGQLHVPTYGGGTARTEYEALTGNAMYFLPADTLQKINLILSLSKQTHDYLRLPLQESYWFPA